ncbi:hypothetical protein FGG08_005646 [Glutinoglossum americanum]|uniref:Cystathionine gamma-synthase n=1 Tax=Glutinoglossum americanum TaxID=1670608 RepID=A0A9P8HY19_9PEZI|nr:hypothetical protein FGG08_005646 [Glutinoglossum americanum]
MSLTVPLGHPLPPRDPHIGEYARFFIHDTISSLSRTIIAKFGQEGEQAMLFPSAQTASHCLAFLREQSPSAPLRIMEIIPDIPVDADILPWAAIWAVVFPDKARGLAMKVWQHAGEGISSRRAEWCKEVFARCGFKVCRERGGIPPSISAVGQLHGAPLDLTAAAEAKQILRGRISRVLSSGIKPGDKAGVVQPSDVYLYPSGMSAIFNVHQALLAARGEDKRSICFGFTYLDTLKLLTTFGPGCLFLGHNHTALSLLEAALHQKSTAASEQPFLALFCEVPGNPLLHTPDLERIRELADQWGFAVVVDETVGGFLNVDVLPWADVVCTSLTKGFSGRANVMGGSAVINPKSRYHALLTHTLSATYQDTLFPTDALALSHNSLTFPTRNLCTNTAAEILYDFLRAHPAVKKIYYPKHNTETLPFYEKCRRKSGGYGYLMTIVFWDERDAVVFFDRLEVAKGPSLGTNFTLASAYTLLAHFGELEWAAEYGVVEHMVRISVGLEGVDKLLEVFSKALRAVEENIACGRVGE